MARALLALLVLGLILLGVARLGGGAPERAPRALTVAPKAVPQAAIQPGPVRPPEPLAETQFAARPTPTIDLLVKLEARRRLVRVGAAAYLDSMLLTSDSTVRRWPDRPDNWIRIFLTPQLAESIPALGPRLIADAVDRWNGSGAGITLRMVSDSSTADVRIRWIDRFDSDRVGQADVQWLSDGSIHSASVRLATHTKSGEPLPDVVLLAVAVHELGHALGLPHSAAPSDVMYQSTQTSTPSSRDRATLQLLYSLPLGSIR